MNIVGVSGRWRRGCIGARSRRNNNVIEKASAA